MFPLRRQPSDNLKLVTSPIMQFVFSADLLFMSLEELFEH